MNAHCSSLEKCLHVIVIGVGQCWGSGSGIFCLSRSGSEIPWNNKSSHRHSKKLFSRFPFLKFFTRFFIDQFPLCLLFILPVLRILVENAQRKEHIRFYPRVVYNYNFLNVGFSLTRINVNAQQSVAEKNNTINSSLMSLLLTRNT